MKKLKHKIQRLIKKDTKPEEGASQGRITNETVAEHRERILAGGRRFKYPRQYAKHRLIRNTVLVSVGAMILVALFVWWQLYFVQNTSEFFYRVTQLIPVPAATVDGEAVRYSSYLRELRSELHYLESEENVVFSSEDGKRQLEYRKRASLNRVEDNAFVAKLAREHNISLSNQELDAFIDAQIKSSSKPISKEEFIQTVLPRYYDWSLGEYKDSIRPQLLRQKVAFAVDATAKTKADSILRTLQKGANFSKLAKKQSEDEITKANGGDLGFVPLNSADPDGLIAVASRLKKNQLSGIIQGKSGYYVIKLLDKKDSQIRYARIFVGLHELTRMIDDLHKDNADHIREYINVPDTTAPTRR